VLNLINRQYLPVQAKQSVTKVATGTILQLSYTSAVPATGRKRTEKNCKNAETLSTVIDLSEQLFKRLTEQLSTEQTPDGATNRQRVK